MKSCHCSGNFARLLIPIADSAYRLHYARPRYASPQTLIDVNASGRLLAAGAIVCPAE
jgi:hypothetical protein